MIYVTDYTVETSLSTGGCSSRSFCDWNFGEMDLLHSKL